MDLNDFFIQFTKQSQNASAKMALSIDEFFRSYYEYFYKCQNNWKLIDEPIYTTSEVFAFHHTSFYFRIFKAVINKLIDTGIMKYFSDNFYIRKRKLPISKKEPKILKLEDLSFGFNIWLCSCFLSFMVFVFEFFFGMFRTIKFAMIHPIDDNEMIAKSNCKNIEVFRVRPRCRNSTECQ